MAINALINNVHGNRNQSDLIDGLIIESIKARGIDVKYIVRDKVGSDNFLGEARASKFLGFTEIEVYVEDMSGHDGSSDLMSRFGMEFSDTSMFKVSSTRFKEEFIPNHGIDRPREGDLIYFPLSDALFEISKVLMDENFRQLGINYTYRMKCVLFKHSHEELPATDEMETFADMSKDISDNNSLLTTLGLGSVADFTPDNTEEITQTMSDIFDPNSLFPNKGEVT